MDNLDTSINLLLNLPDSVKYKVISLAQEEIGQQAKIELVVLCGQNVKQVRSGVEQLGGNFEDLSYGFGIVTIPIDKIKQVSSITGIQYLELPKDVYLSSLESNKAACIKEAQDVYGVSGKGVLVGFIDSGIDYKVPAFISENGETRIEYICELGINNKVWDKNDINRALKSSNPYDIVPHMDNAGHGTHVASIACAGGDINKQYYGVAYESRIIMVKLASEGGLNFSKSTQIMRGVKFIVDKARELNMPLVINLSFSTNDGAHDGSSLLEQYIYTICNLEKITFVVASGNEGDMAHHVGGPLRPTQNINFNIAGGEKSLILQLYRNILSDISIEIVNSSGITTGKINLEAGYKEGNIGRDKYYIYNSGPKPISINGEIVIAFIPTANFLLSGQWKITLYNSSSEPGRYNIWMPISEGLSRDTKFLQPNVANTLGIPATVDNVISVGSYNYNNNSISSFSGRGAKDSNKPNIVAPGEQIEGFIPGGIIDALTGTSMAAPHVAGACALMIQWAYKYYRDGFMYGERLKYFLLKGAKRGRENIQYPNNTWGYGTLCLRNSIDIAEISYMRNNSFKDIEEYIRYYRQNDCKEKYIDENYYNILVEYNGDILAVIDKLDFACINILDDNYAIITVRSDKLNELLKNTKEIVYVEMPTLFTNCNISPIDAANISQFHQNKFLNLTGQGVIIGIIDSGIDYLNTEFIYENDKTRIVSIWDQTVNTGKSPEEFELGTEYSREVINKAIQLSKSGGDPYSIVPSKDTIGHGTAMAGIVGARGKNPEIVGAAPDCEFGIVKLKEAKKNTLALKGVTSSSCASYNITEVILGIKYLYNLAKKNKRPLVLLIPLGTNMGSHDGNSILERYVDEISKTRGVCVVTGCGNEGDSDTHTSGRLGKTGDEKTIELKVAENEKNISFQIWGNKPDKFSLSIVSPSGEVIEKISAKLKEVEVIQFVFEGSFLTIQYFIPEESTGDELINILINNVREGIWQFKLIGDLVVDGRYDAWLPQRALIREGTRFLNPNQYTTLTIPSTGRQILSSAFYDQNNNRIVAASGRGYTRDERIKPDIAAGGVSVLTTAVGGGTQVISGSSAAAAVLAGAVALLFQWGIVDGNDKTLYAPKIKTYLIRGATKRPGDAYPNREWGYGILNLMGVFENIRYLENSRLYIRLPKYMKKQSK
ncbi:S8 family serine peptidase [Clostridium rectalis]|uniref:S8 family serine peptidase n=1 Tax=Clostridium rectalis TaxID=2040295 RepID=UPI001FA9DAEF|nr:S8 family serine peptidase [Clostridium rectalis]